MITTLKFSTPFSLCFPVTCCITVPTGPLALIFFFCNVFGCCGSKAGCFVIKKHNNNKKMPSSQHWFSSASEQSLWEPIPLKLPETSESPSLILLICVIFSLSTQPSWKSQWTPRHQQVHEAWGPPWLFGETDLTQHSCKRSPCWRLARSVAVSEKLCALQYDHHLCFISSRPTCFTTIRNYCLGVLNYSRRGSGAQGLSDVTGVTASQEMMLPLLSSDTKAPGPLAEWLARRWAGPVARQRESGPTGAAAGAPVA